MLTYITRKTKAFKSKKEFASNMKTKIIFVALATLLFQSIFVYSQEANKIEAFSCEKGIFLILKKKSKYKFAIERKEVELQDSDFEKIAEHIFPDKFDQLEKNYDKFKTLFPDIVNLEKSRLSFLYKNYFRFENVDSLKFFQNSPAALFSLGFLYYDFTAETNKKYIYRVKEIDEKMQAVFSTYESNEVVYLDKREFPKVNFINYQPCADNLTLIFKMQRIDWLAKVLVFRKKEPYDYAYKQIYPIIKYFIDNDSVKIEIVDTSAKKYNFYRYIITPIDIFGMRGDSSESVFCHFYDYDYEPPIKELEAEALKDQVGIKLKWRVDKTEMTSLIAIYKSENYDYNFSLCYTVPSDVEEFIDYNVEPGKIYWYYLQLKSVFEEYSPESHRVFAYVKNYERPIPPQNLTAKRNKKSVVLTWNETQKYIKGYYVYRKAEFQKEFVLISNLIPVKTFIEVEYVDSLNIGEKDTYAYYVVKINQSDLLSIPSDTVWAKPIFETFLPNPINFTAEHIDDKIFVYWEDMRKIYKNIKEYKLYKKVISYNKSYSENSKFELIGTFQTNGYFDINFNSGDFIEYLIQSVDWNDKVSSGAIAAVKVEVPKSYAPFGLISYLEKEKVALKWKGVMQKDLIKYKIYRGEDDQEPIVIAEVEPKEENKFFDENAEVGKKYVYYVTSVNKYNQESGKSEKVIIRR